MKSGIRTRPRHSGFSLIEVLIAVVVLATGLLALTALQGRLAQVSADAKIRSRVAAMLTARMDELRAGQYENAALNVNTGTGSATANFSCVSGAPAWLCTAQTESAVTGLQVAQRIDRFTSAIGAGAFTVDGTAPANLAIPEFKRVILTATWSDAAGAARRLSVSSDLSPLSLAGNLIPPAPGASSSSGSPTVRQDNPSGAGMIPIAVGNNTDTAATNPKPELGSQSANQSLPSTRFDVLTYQNETGGSAVIQKRVETTVVACACKNSNNPAELTGYLAQQAYRPTYWDGTRYGPPERIPVTSIQSGPYTANGDIKQSDICTQCCRDHRDASADTVKFNNLNNDYNRYQLTYSPAVTTGPPSGRRPAIIEMTRNASGDLVVAGNNEIYAEACRVIRVDGFWRVASDSRAVHMGMVATTAQGFATSPVPDPSAASRYEQFVKSFLGGSAQSAAGHGSVPDANTLYNENSLNEPDVIPSVSNAVTYLHARGLYFDHLEPAAVAKLQSVWDSCAVTSRPGCLLPYLPFTAINVTELGSWAKTPSNTTVLTSVTNGSGSISGNGLDPIRGKVTAGTAGGLLSPVTADVALGRSNSALAASLLDINPYDANPLNDWIDSQPYVVTGLAASGQFNVNVMGIPQVGDLSTTNDPVVGWGIGTLASDCMTSISRSDLNPNPYNCVTTTPLIAVVSVAVGGYNLREQRSEVNPCGGTEIVQRPYLVCHTVDPTNLTMPTGYNTSIVQGGTLRTPSETATITFTNPLALPVPSGTTFGIGFIPNGESGGSFTCDAITGQVTFTPATACSPP